jgi:nicotinamidase/pyrazinamidase
LTTRVLVDLTAAVAADSAAKALGEMRTAGIELVEAS